MADLIREKLKMGNANVVDCFFSFSLYLLSLFLSIHALSSWSGRQREMRERALLRALSTSFSTTLAALSPGISLNYWFDECGY